MPPRPYKLVLLLIVQAIFVSSCAAQQPGINNSPAIPLTDCVLNTPGISVQVDARCGELKVPENRTDANGRQIDLHIAVIPSIKRNAEPDPLFVLVGGPGQSAIETYPSISSMLFQIHEARDIVLVDQRGTGGSNPLRCLNPEDETLDEEQVIAQLKACPDKLDADPRYYTTDIAMQDLDAVRSALGYETINLYGVSYGTRAALVYLKMYPSRVRTITLDAVVDPAFVIYQDAAQDGQNALDLFFARCEQDEACKSTYPNVRSEFDTILQRLDETPQETTIAHPVTGKPYTFTVTRDFFTRIIFNVLYAADLVAMLPLAIHQAYAENNFAPLIAQGYLLDAGIYDGMFYSVACTEDAPLLLPPDDQASAFSGTAQTFAEICTAWPQGALPAVVHELISSDVPTLMLSGEADPITPPWHAEQLAGSLTNSLHMIFKDMGHGNTGTECAVKILDQFVATASVKDLNVSCVDSVEPPPFFVDFSGPKP